MSRPLRLVMIAPYPVLPAVAGGKVRIVQLARALSQLGVDVTVVAPFHFTQRRELAAKEPFALLQVPYAAFALPFLFVDHPFPYGALVSYHPGYGALLPVRLGDFDVCQIEHPAFVDLAQRIPESVPIVYGSQNVELDYVSAECKSDLVRRLCARRVRKLEARLIARSTHVLACTEGDRQRFAELYEVPLERIAIVPNGLDLAEVDRISSEREGSRIPSPLPRRALFTGSAVRHNREAVRSLVTRVAPRLEGQAELAIVGPCARTWRGPVGPNVRMDPDGELADYAGGGAVGVNPVVDGSGSSLKLLHYLAHGMPVVSTPFGMRGFADLAPWILRAELDDFPAAIRGELPDQRGLRDALARYDWNEIARTALDVYRSLTGAAAISSESA